VVLQRVCRTLLPAKELQEARGAANKITRIYRGRL
jgi:hypothetical protein